MRLVEQNNSCLKSNTFHFTFWLEEDWLQDKHEKNNKVSELHRPTYKSGSLFADTFTHLHVLVYRVLARLFQKQLHSSLSYVGDRTVGYFSIQHENAHMCVFCLIVFPLQLSINKLKTNQKM